MLECPIAKCHACVFPDFALFFQGGGFKGQKSYAIDLYFLGMGRCLAIRMSFLG